ncbi:hypothetical protein Desru_0811 [Desulforamulus ruminis DSM 2154]|uniref:Uncharacterized protein n=1 Tax=Desulforamulus ruminis (strain ATCC 23193 / DSM 2154 / NCIMB 8452 / DL) TaxID=696281 RepID=F6DV24_DESRL|nr:hypothetical protein Desru_0811 [Desulforamulus ruminis DSM 2154]
MNKELINEILDSIGLESILLDKEQRIYPEDGLVQRSME